MKNPQPATPRLRVQVLDILRGFSVISMVAYHAMYDLVFIYALPAPWYLARPGFLWQQSICWVFILVAGASLHHSRRPMRHALLVLACAAALSLITAIAAPNMFIAFGVLHMLGACMFLAALFWRPLAACPAVPGLIFCVSMFVLLYGLPMGFVGVLGLALWRLPLWLYAGTFLFFLGLPSASFASSDYFPILPWCFLFFAGYFLWAILKEKAKPTPVGGNVLAFIGRHSLIIYMLHQPALLGLFWLIILFNG